MMILGSKHVGAILIFFMLNFYVCASVGILIKYFDDMHGATIRISKTKFLYSLFYMQLVSMYCYI